MKSIGSREKRGATKMKENVLTVSSVARLIGKSEGAVRYAAATGKLPFMRTTNGQRLFRERDVQEFVAKISAKEEEEPRPAA
jgi:excisionase family DNA binding protein